MFLWQILEIRQKQIPFLTAVFLNLNEYSFLFILGI